MSAPAAANISGGNIGRAVFSARDWRYMEQNGKPPPRLFRDNASPVQISVHRLDVKSDKETTMIGDAIAKNRQRAVFCGWAELTIAAASKDGRKVRDLKEWWHAAIVLPCEEDDQHEREKHAELLSREAASRRYPAR